MQKAFDKLDHKVQILIIMIFIDVMIIIIIMIFRLVVLIAQMTEICFYEWF